MKNSRTMRYTVQNNLNGTHDLLCAVVEAGLHDTHIVHLGSIGVYGYRTTGARFPKVIYPSPWPPGAGRKKLKLIIPPSPAAYII